MEVTIDLEHHVHQGSLLVLFPGVGLLGHLLGLSLGLHLDGVGLGLSPQGHRLGLSIRGGHLFHPTHFVFLVGHPL